MIKLHEWQRAVVKTKDDENNWTEMKRVMRQGCMLSWDRDICCHETCFYSTHSPSWIKLENFNGVKIEGINIYNIRCANFAEFMNKNRKSY